MQKHKIYCVYVKCRNTLQVNYFLFLVFAINFDCFHGKIDLLSFTIEDRRESVCESVNRAINSVSVFKSFH